MHVYLKKFQFFMCLCHVAVYPQRCYEQITFVNNRV